MCVNISELKNSILDKHRELKQLEFLNKHIRKECYGNPNQQSIKKIAANMDSCLSLSRVGGIASARELLQKYTNEKKKVYPIHTGLSCSRKEGKHTPARMAVYKELAGTLYFVGYGSYFYEPWNNWLDFIYNNEYSNDYAYLDKLCYQAENDDYRRLAYKTPIEGRFFTYKKEGRSFILLDTGEPVLEEEFSFLKVDDFEMLLAEKCDDQKPVSVSVNRLRNICIRNSQVNFFEVTRDLYECKEYSTAGGFLIDELISDFLFGEEIVFKVPKNKKIEHWPELVLKAHSKIIENFECLNRIFIGEGYKTKFWRNKVKLKKTPFKYIRNMAMSGVRYNTAFQGHIYELDVFCSKNLGEWETLLTNSVESAKEYGPKYIKFALED